MLSTLKQARFACALGMTGLLASACAADPGDPNKIQTGPSSGNSSTASSGVGPTSGVVTSGSSGVSGSGSATGSGSGSAVTGATTGASSGVATTGTTSGTGTVADASISDVAVVVPLSPLEVDYLTTDKTPASENQLQFQLQVINRGGASVNLSDVTLRYWFSIDGNGLSSLYFQSYYAQINSPSTAITTDITSNFVSAPAANVTPTSDTYLEVGFAAGSGSLPPGVGASIQVDVRGPGAAGYSEQFNELNDYSFEAVTAFTAWVNVTGYVGGQIAWGVEPGTGASFGGADGGTDATLPAEDAAAGDAVAPVDATAADAAASSIPDASALADVTGQ